jgi:GT2 family glycosyltransferase
MDNNGLEKIGVVTVTYNSAAVLPDFLASLWRQTHNNFVLYVIDNASRDNTLEQLAAQTDTRLRIEASPSNPGVAEGNNAGIRMALGEGCDAVLLLNNDVVFPPQLIETLIESQRANRSDMVAPKMMYYEPPDRIWWAGGYFKPALGYLPVHRGIDQVDAGQFNNAIPVAYSPTCCVLARKEVFAKLGMMDAKYFVYWDDTDFMLRAHKAHLVLFYEPAALLHHKVGSLTKGSGSRFVLHLLTRNRVYYWLKHLDAPRACFYIASLTAFYLIKYCLRIKPGPVLKIQLKAILDGVKLA